MTEKAYNLYLRMTRLACNNVKTEICKINGLQDESLVQIRIRHKDRLVSFVEQVIQNPTNAVALYSDKITPLLSVTVKTQLAHTLTASVVFIESIIKSRDARVCQKRLIDYAMAEMYMVEAYNYDMKHPYNQVADSAIEKAKEVIVKLYSINFLSNFSFDGGIPRFDDEMRESLQKQAFDPRYSFTTKEANEKLIHKKYVSEFGGRKDYFLMDAAERKQAFKIDSIKGVGKSSKSALDFLNKPDPSVDDTTMLTELYKGSFANLPLQNRRRKFVNLKVRNRDILLCPKRNLATKRQYANIESLTKRHYIYDFYDDQMPVEAVDTADYYYRQELHMYQYMWNTAGIIHNKNGKLYFPDGTSMQIPKSMEAYEFLHKINTVYAALFGFSPDDMKGGKNWLYDSIRRAYTDEGTADYRLAMIDARLRGKIK